MKDISLLRLAAFQTVAQLLPISEIQSSSWCSHWHSKEEMHLDLCVQFSYRSDTYQRNGHHSQRESECHMWCCGPTGSPGMSCAGWREQGQGWWTVSIVCFSYKCYLCMYIWLPRWPSGKESACQCRLLGFDPWVGKTPWSRKWQPTPGFLPGKSHGQGSLAGYSPWGCKESGMTERAHRHLSISTVVFLR